jgi:hypothetical protein
MLRSIDMKKIFSVLVLVILFSGIVMAGALFGRILQENGKPLAKTVITIEDEKSFKKSIKTNEFGGYSVELPDGERELKVTINNVQYTSEMIMIFSPKTRQNWKIENQNKKLMKTK